MALKVQDQSPEVEAMAANWPIVAALLGGTAAMRAAAKAFLPQWPNEDKASYDARLATATLFPALARTLSVMVGKPFSKQLTLGDDVSETIKGWLDNCDQQGNNLHTFAADLMTEAMGYGLCGVLVDYPQSEVVPKNAAGVATKAAEASAGVRPYTVMIRHGQILGWKSERRAGAVVLTQLRIFETAEVPDGEYGVAVMNRVRVFEPGRWVLFEEQQTTAGKEYVQIREGITTLKTIPFVPFYGRKKGYMCGVSPLLEVAHLNVKHWQSQSDQDTILHVARVPVLVMVGADEPGPDGTGGTQLTVGASAAVRLPMNASLAYVEHTGAAIEAGQLSLDKLLDQMIESGAELLIQRPNAAATATEVNNDAEANKSDLQRIVEGFEDGLDQVLQLMADWVNEKQGGHCSLFKDFAAGSLTDASAQLILSLQQGGLLSKQTTIKEYQRRGTIAPDIDPETELAAAEEDGPALGTMGAGGGGE